MTQNEEIMPGLPIICADDLIHGFVAQVEDLYVMTTPLEDGQRHYIPLELVTHVNDGVYLSVTYDELSALL